MQQASEEGVPGHPVADPTTEFAVEGTLLRALVNATDEGIMLVDGEGRIAFWNDRFLDLWNLPRDLIGQREASPVEAWLAGRVRNHAEGIPRSLGAGAESPSVSTSDVLELADGRWLERTVQSLGNRPGSFQAFRYRDISDQVAAESARRTAEASYRTIFNLATEAMYVHDPNTGAILDVNRQAMEFHGLTREQFQKLGLRAVSAGEAPFSEIEALDYVHRAAGGEPQLFIWCARHSSGRRLWIEVSLRAAVIDGENRVLSTARDVTERIEAEAVLHRSQEELERAVSARTAELAAAHAVVREREEQYRALADADPDGIVVMDDDSNIRSVNPAMEKIFGYCADELIGQPLVMLMPESMRSAHRDGVARYLATGRRGVSWVGLQVPGRRKGGAEVPLEINFGEYALDGRHCFAGFIRDITDRKRTEEALQAAKEEAERANLAKSEFLSRMSHELRTPLNSILGFGQVLARRDLPLEQRKNVDHIMKAGRHLLTLIDEVLDIARIEADRQELSLEPVQVGRLLEEAFVLIRPMAQQRSIELPEHAPALFDEHVRADRQRLMQVVLNLLSNAVKYNHDGGSVELVGELREATTAGAGASFALGVRDTGPGIDPDRMDELFVPFSRLGAEQDGVEGTGLGLALSQRLVEAMNGSLRVDSELGHGSTFWVELPLAAHPMSRLDGYRQSAPSPLVAQEPGQSGLILYVEDNLANLNLVESIFEHRPEIQIVPALQGRMGIELAREHKPDLILLDLHLPDMKGEDVLRELRSDSRTSEIPVLIISADATPRQISRLRLAGARGYLTKPLDLDEFLREVDTALAPDE